jgi:excisionase family DNA binding protein
MANGSVKPGILSYAALWDANDVARYLKVSRSWVYHRAELGLLPCVRIGALLRFEPAKVQQFVLGHPPVSPPPAVVPTVAAPSESHAPRERR